MAKKQFKTESKRMLDLMINSIYTNKEIFVLSAVGCMDTERDGLESILAGNDEGAKGCCLSVDMTADGIAVLSSDGYCIANDGTRSDSG